MKQNSQSSGIITIGLAIFSMLFGAGNIIYPIASGVFAGSKNYAGILGFILTGVILPVIGLIGMILFEGNYKRFFNRLGKIPGSIAILYCMLIIGPLLAMPRCITVPYEMLSPFIGNISLPIFSIIFGLITFIMSYSESKILEILGKFVSPVLLGSLAIIIVKGLWQAETMVEQSMPTLKIFISQFTYGFQTLDLLGALFFAYIVIRILKSNRGDQHIKTKELAITSLKGGMIGAGLLMAVYVCFSYLGAYYGHSVLANSNGAEMFRNIALQIIHHYGVLILVIAVLLACLSTITALAAVFAEYLHYEIFNKKLCYRSCLTITVALTTFISNFGLSNILKYGEHPIMIGYPIIIATVFCNIAYSLFNFKPIKTPVAITAVVTTSLYTYLYLL